MSALAALRNLALALTLGVCAGSAFANSYEAQLPPELNSSPRMCDYVACADVMPGADSFSERKGQPPYV